MMGKRPYKIEVSKLARRDPETGEYDLGDDMLPIDPFYNQLSQIVDLTIELDRLSRVELMPLSGAITIYQKHGDKQFIWLFNPDVDHYELRRLGEEKVT